MQFLIDYYTHLAEDMQFLIDYLCYRNVGDLKFAALARHRISHKVFLACSS